MIFITNTEHATHRPRPVHARCCKTRLHRVVRNLHLILLAPRERPGMRWGLATLESEDYVLCSYSPHSVTECSPALASLSAFCQVTRARPGPLLISRSSTSGTTTVDLGPALWALPDPVAHVASNRRTHLGVQTSYKSPFTAYRPERCAGEYQNAAKFAFTAFH